MSTDLSLDALRKAQGVSLAIQRGDKSPGANKISINSCPASGLSKGSPGESGMWHSVLFHGFVSSGNHKPYREDS